jgi:hypothetical protein
MSPDESLKGPDVRFRQIGVGHQSKWSCPRCKKPQWTMVGRRLRLVRGMQTWVCGGCA